MEPRPPASIRSTVHLRDGRSLGGSGVDAADWRRAAWMLHEHKTRCRGPMIECSVMESGIPAGFKVKSFKLIALPLVETPLGLAPLEKMEHMPSCGFVSTWTVAGLQEHASCPRLQAGTGSWVSFVALNLDFSCRRACAIAVPSYQQSPPPPKKRNRTMEGDSVTDPDEQPGDQ